MANNQNINPEEEKSKIENEEELADKKENSSDKSDEKPENEIPNSDENINEDSIEEEIEVEKPEELSEIEILNKKIEEQNDKYLRLFSEFDNFRKRTIKEKTDIYKTAGFEIIKDLLPIVDDFERAIGSIDDKEEIKAHKDGMLFIYNKLTNMLKQKGLTEIEAYGEKFDTDLHEAVTKIKAPKKKLKGKVVDVLEKGYKLNDKVVRYSKVVIGE